MASISLKKLLSYFLIIGVAFQLCAEQEASQYGFIPLTERQLQHIERHLHHVTQVNPNEVGADRIHAHRKSQKLEPVTINPALKHCEEFSTHLGNPPQKIHFSPPSAPLPSSIDNSILPSFPPIGDQKQIGSCVAWASTYYQATHEIGMVNGANNKTNNEGILSPKWTYNLLNGGVDRGLVVTDAYSLLSQNGAAKLNNFPYDNNFLAWDLNVHDWTSALFYRTNKAQMIGGLGGKNPQDLQLIKQALNNGHVLTFATYVDSWVFTHIKNDPSASSNPYLGQLAGAWMNGTKGGHCMTIVGYDDNIWIDVNGNGKVDPGERGAFLIANSWSSHWGNNGFVWLSYDAFLGTSAVPNGPNNARVPAGDPLNNKVISIVPLTSHYSPRLIAQFTLSQAVRNQLSVQAGISSTSAKTPSKTFVDYALKNHGGNYEYDGTNGNAPETATFVVDLTDLLNSAPADTDERYYLILADNAQGNPTTLIAFSLIDLEHNIQVDYPDVPLVFDNSSLTVYLDYDLRAASVLTSRQLN